MSSSVKKFNEILKFIKVYNQVSDEKITPLEALKAYIQMEKQV